MKQRYHVREVGFGIWAEAAEDKFIRRIEGPEHRLTPTRKSFDTEEAALAAARSLCFDHVRVYSKPALKNT